MLGQRRRRWPTIKPALYNVACFLCMVSVYLQTSRLCLTELHCCTKPKDNYVYVYNYIALRRFPKIKRQLHASLTYTECQKTTHIYLYAPIFDFPVGLSAKHLHNTYTMLDQRRRRWTNIV